MTGTHLEDEKAIWRGAFENARKAWIDGPSRKPFCFFPAVDASGSRTTLVSAISCLGKQHSY